MTGSTSARRPTARRLTARFTTSGGTGPGVEGDFARIERWTGPDGVAHWRVTSRDNVTTVFGRTEAARIAEPGHPERVFEWLAEERRDDRGGVVSYVYIREDTRGVDPGAAHEAHRVDRPQPARLLKSVRYGNARPGEAGGYVFELVLDYGDHDEGHPSPEPDRPWPVRPDPYASGRAGFEVRVWRRCRRLLMFHVIDGVPTLAHSTVLGYDDAPTGGTLTSVTRVGADGVTALAPLRLGYTEAVLDPSVRELDEASAEHLPAGLTSGYTFVDLDGEGLAGILAEADGGWFYKRNLGGGRFAAAVALTPLPVPAGLAASRARLLDLDGDGRRQLTSLRLELPGFAERTDDGSWARFTPFPAMPRIDWDDPNLRLVDLDADGRADALVTEEGGLRWYRSAGRDGFEAGQRVPVPADEEDGPAVLFADGTQSLHLADMSGDGLTDLVRVRAAEVCYWPNLGYGRFGPKVTMSDAPVLDPPGRFDPRRVRLSDVDGSGTTDLVYLHADGVRLYRNASGNRFVPGPAVPDLPHLSDVDDVSVLDLLGTGTGYLVWSTPMPTGGRGLRYVDLTGGKPYLLSTVDNGLGARTALRYTPSTAFYRADAAAGTPWLTRLPFPVQCLSRVEVADAPSDTRLVSTYSYHHGYYARVEREFRGFTRVDRIDAEDFGTGAQDRGGQEQPGGEDATVVLPPAGARDGKGVRVVHGRVRYGTGAPGTGLTVHIGHRSLRGDTGLGSGPTGADGGYRISYRCAGRVDLVASARTADGTLLGESGVVFDAGPTEEIDLALGDPPGDPRSEYERLLAALGPHLDGVALASLAEAGAGADPAGGAAGRRAIALLAGKTGLPAGRIAQLATAHALAARAGLAPEVAYALVRQGVASDLAGLVAAADAGRTGAAVPGDAVRAAVAEGLVPASAGPHADALAGRLRDLAGRQVTADRASALRGVLSLILPDEAAGADFVGRYLAWRGPVDGFWATLHGDARLGPKVAQLQLGVQLATLAGGHPPLVRTLLDQFRAGNLRTFADLAAYPVADWERLIRSAQVPADQLTPAGLPGTDPDQKVAVYARTLARVVEDALPTAVFAYAAQRDEAAPADLRTFWRNTIEHGVPFELGAAAVDRMLAEHPQLLGGVGDRDGLAAGLRLHQRLFNLTPRYAEVEALRTAGFTSARDLALAGPDLVANRLAGRVEAGRIGPLTEKAAHVAAASAYLVTGYSARFAAPELYVLPAPDAKRSATLATLFDSLDQGICAECESITSPAAYLAELMAFLADRRLAASPAAGGTPAGGSAQQALLARRPDLAELELTCPNTNTPLPMIDLVNEVLEDAVAPFERVTLAGDHQAELDARRVADRLLDEFRRAGLPLGPSPQVTVAQAGRRWVVSDHSLTYTLVITKARPAPGGAGLVVTSPGVPDRRTCRAARGQPRARERGGVRGRQRRGVPVVTAAGPVAGGDRHLPRAPRRGPARTDARPRPAGPVVGTGPAGGGGRAPRADPARTADPGRRRRGPAARPATRPGPAGQPRPATRPGRPRRVRSTAAGLRGPAALAAVRARRARLAHRPAPGTRAAAPYRPGLRGTGYVWRSPVSAVSASPAAGGSILDPVRALQHALYRAAKADPGRRFHALRDKIFSQGCPVAGVGRGAPQRWCAGHCQGVHRKLSSHTGRLAVLTLSSRATRPSKASSPRADQGMDTALREPGLDAFP